MAGNGARMLEAAVLAHLSGAPMHGYELRKRLDHELGAFRAFSYGSLYPCLKSLLRRGLITREDGAGAGRRPSRIVYRATPDGREALHTLLSDTEPAAEDEHCFGVHFSLFSRTRQDVRLHILRERRLRLQHQLDRLRARLCDPEVGADPYACELHRHRAAALEGEVAWLDGLIDRERRCAPPAPAGGESIGGTAPPPTGPR
ncbi:PadR family transcriptional regulator [Nocardiopsis coralliicola]